MCNKNSGSAMIYVLMVGVVMASTLLLLQQKSRIFTKRVDAMLRQSDAKFMALGAVFMGQSLLENDNEGNVTDGAGDKWFAYKNKRTFPIEDGAIAFRMDDAARLPNVNDIRFYGSDRTEYTNFIRRYTQDIGFNSADRQDITNWMDVNYAKRMRSGYGFSDDQKSLPTGESFKTHDELLRAMETPDQRRKQAVQQLSILPDTVKYNINTISTSFINALFTGQSLKTQSVLNKRKSKAYVAVGDFLSDLNYQKTTKGVELVTTSTYFDVDVNVSFKGGKKNVEALLDRSKNNVIIRRLAWH